MGSTRIQLALQTGDTWTNMMPPPPVSMLSASVQWDGYRSAIIPLLIAAFVALSLLGIYYFLKRPNLELAPKRHWLARIIYLGFLGTLVVLSLTSFTAVRRDEVMQHYALMIHLTAAGAFTALLFPVAVLFLPRSLRSPQSWWLESLSSWTLVVCSTIAAGTMLIGLTPLLNTEGLSQFLGLHRYAGLGATVAAAFHLLALIVRRWSSR